MDRLLLSHLPAVLAVARTRSFVRAAAELGLGSSAVSHSIRAVEDRLGVALFARTTRSVSLTEAGSVFVETAERAVEEFAAGVERVRAGQRRVSGLLRINAPRLAQRIGLTPILADMTRRHPELTVEIVTDDALRDIVAEGFDAGIRLGEMIAKDMVAVRLTPPCRAIVVAAPTYLADRQRPQSIADLAGHNCIGFRLLGSGAVYPWDLNDRGKDVRVDVSGSIRLSDPVYARELALEGLGVAYVMEPLVSRDLASGRLVELLPQAAIEEPGLFIYFAQRTARSAKMRALLDVIARHRMG